MADTDSLDSFTDWAEPHSKDRSRRATFILTCLASATELYNLWRYPFLVYKHGGVVLVPCLVLFMTVGFPLFYLELTLGQVFTGAGGIAGQMVGRIVPVFRGVGYANVLLLLLISIYHMAIISWTLLYLFKSMAEVLPWSYCQGDFRSIAGSGCEDLANATLCEPSATENCTVYRASNEKYFHEQIIRMSPGLEELGYPNWMLILCLVCASFIAYLNVMKFKFSFRKMAIIPAIALLLLLCVFLASASQLPGFRAGVNDYLSFDFEKLRHAQIWGDSATQVVLTLGVGSGLIQMLGRRSHLPYVPVLDIIGILTCNLLLAFFSGLVSFACLGALAAAIQSPELRFLPEGFGMPFVVQSAILSRLPGPVIWSILFFSLLALLSVGRQVEIVLCLAATVLEKFNLEFLRRHRSWVVSFVCSLVFCFGIPIATGGGIHVLAVIDYYAVGWPALIFGFMECVAITWVYGANRFIHDVETMLQQPISLLWKYTWGSLTPAVILVLVLFTCIMDELPSLGVFQYGALGRQLGWCLFWLVVGVVPFYAVWRLTCAYMTPDGSEAMKQLCKGQPLQDLPHRIRKPDSDEKLANAPLILMIREEEESRSPRGKIPYGFTLSAAGKKHKAPDGSKDPASAQSHLMNSLLSQTLFMSGGIGAGGGTWKGTGDSSCATPQVAPRTETRRKSFAEAGRAQSEPCLETLGTESPPIYSPRKESLNKQTYEAPDVRIEAPQEFEGPPEIISENNSQPKTVTPSMSDARYKFFTSSPKQDSALDNQGFEPPLN